MVLVIYLFATCVIMNTVSCQTNSKYNTFGRVGDVNQKYMMSPYKEIAADNAFTCARKCRSTSACLAFNVWTNGQSSECAFFDSSAFKKNVWASLTDETNWQYFEKTCQAYSPPQSALLIKDDKGNGNNSSNEPMIVYTSKSRAGQVIYALKFNETGELADFRPMNVSLPVIVESMGHSFWYDDRVDAHQKGGHDTVFFTGDSAYFFDDNVGKAMPIKWFIMNWDVLKAVDAMLSFNGTGGGYIFSDRKVYKVERAEWGRWKIVNEYEITHVSDPNNPWWNAPHGVVAAVWLSFVDNGEQDRGYGPQALLFTAYYYVLYDMTTQEVLYRGQLCLN